MTAPPLSSDYLDRFSGIARLYGSAGLARLHDSHVAVIGVGGVGSWSAEALARSGVGKLTLVDADEICVTNVNRQLHALDGVIGQPKTTVLAERIRLINPHCDVREERIFFTAATADHLLSPGYDAVIDAIDPTALKALLIAACRERGYSTVVAGGAGGKIDPASIRTCDLAFATNDKLLRGLRKMLRNEYSFPSEASGEPFGIRCIHSVENARYPWSDGSVREHPEPGSHLRLNCATGFGTATAVAGSFGFAAAAEAIKLCLGELGDMTTDAE